MNSPFVQHVTNPAKCNSIHKSILEQFKHAAVWGRSVKHQGQLCGLSHQLEDEDISKLLCFRALLKVDC